MDETSKFIYNIWQPTVVRTGAPVVVELNSINDYGFFSMYSIDTEGKDWVISNSTTAGFTGKIWSKRLWIDIDDNEEAKNNLERKLEENGTDYVTYASGGRGYHVGILRNHPPSSKLHIKDKYWVRQNCPEADMSLYSPLHLLRRPGDRHEKTGQVKREIKRHEGKALDFTKMAVPDSFLNPVQIFRSEPHPTKSIFDDLYVRGLMKPATKGNRHHTSVCLAHAMLGRGYCLTVTKHYLYEQNKLNYEPKDTAELDKILEDISERYESL